MVKNRAEPTKRIYSFAVRAKGENAEGVIVGRPIVYDSVTDIGCFAEVIERGALDKADLSDVRFLINHDLDKIPLARAREGVDSTMTLAVDDKGLLVEISLDTENNTDARALYSAVKRGDVTGMSFMFSVADEEWENLDSDYPTRRIKEIAVVLEVSAVTFPAYEDTEIHTRDKKVLDDARAMLSNTRKRQEMENDNELELLKLKTKVLERM